MFPPARVLLLLAWAVAGPLRGVEPAVVPAATGAPAPSVHEIVQRAVAQDNVRRLRRVALECEQNILTEQLDPAGKVVKSKTVRMVYHPTANISFSTSVESKPSGPPGKPDEATVKAQHIMAVMDLGKLAPRFTETVIGSAVVHGRDCYIVAYRPKPGQPADSREEKVVNNVGGRFWIAKDNYDILQSEGSLVGPVTVALIASVTRMDFKFDSQPLPNGDVGPASFSVDMAVKAPFTIPASCR